MPKVTNSETNRKKCSCPKCPSYNECAKTKMEGLFCAGEIGKGSCAYQTNGCLCGECAVYKENQLKAGYYCIKGSADEVDNLR